MNKWSIPERLEEEVKSRDQVCVYCGTVFDSSKKRSRSSATWEHIINDARLVSRGNIARCCVACNSSKGTKKLTEWLESPYCRKLGISRDTVAEVVRVALADHTTTHEEGA